jgi:hypothetical protein
MIRRSHISGHDRTYTESTCSRSAQQLFAADLRLVETGPFAAEVLDGAAIDVGSSHLWD